MQLPGSDFYPAFFNESYVNFWEFCVCLHSNIGLVLSSGEVNSTLFLWKPLDISLVQKLENAGWMSSQIKIWLINVWVNLIKLLAVHSRTPSDFINIQKFKANLIVAFPSSFIWPWIRTRFILTLPHPPFTDPWSMVQLDQVTIIYIHFFLCKYTYNSNSKD